MKLSEALEWQLRNGRYLVISEFMCHCIEADQSIPKHERLTLVSQIMAMVHSIHPSCHSSVTALSLSGAEVFEHVRDSPSIRVRRQNINRVTKQFYCWWIFDLKRKGL